MMRNPPLEADRRSAVQEIPCFIVSEDSLPSKILGFHGSEDSCWGLLGCDAM